MSISDSSSQRVGDAERQAAIDALGEHWRAGRLDPAEHERRTTAAFRAVTRGDLDALFTDLPSGAPVLAPTTVTPGVPAVGADPHTGDGRTGGLFPADSWVAQHSSALMAITPFAALALFFVTGQWIWFLLVPVMGVVLFAGGDDAADKERKRLKREEKERRRLEGR